jgi:PAS domain S-box-containing protein
MRHEVQSGAGDPSPTAVHEFRRYADSLPIFVWTQTRDGRIDWANRTWHDYVQLPEKIATTPEGWAEVIHPDDLASVLDVFGQAINGRTVFECEHRIKPAGAAEDAYRWMLARATPQFDAAGQVVSWLGTGIDIHDARMRGAERAALLAQLAEKEAESFRTIADSVPQMMWSARADGWVEWYNRRWYEYTGQTRPQAEGWGWHSVHHPDELPRLQRGWTASLAAAEPFEMEVRMRGADGGYRMFLSRAIPLRDAAGTVVRWFGTSTDIDFEYNLRMRERRIAQTFQNAALQATLPTVPGIEFDAIYVPAQSDALIGGDWFDAFRLMDGRIVMSVGDVAGNGLNAAVTMGSLRQSIRTAALINPDPIAVLAAVDRIARDMSADLFATAFIAVFDPIHHELRYASAGHPPPLLRTREGNVTTLGTSSLPLGLRQRDFELAPFVAIEPGTLLVMYTDGLSELDRDPVAGEARLLATLRTLEPREHPAHELYHAIVTGPGPHDDIAILTATFSDDVELTDRARGIWRWTFDVTDAAAARATRNAFAALLARAGLAADDIVSAELVFAELVGNVVRYAARTVRVALDVTAESPVLHVLDEGSGFEHNPRLPGDMLSEHGRGLYIVSHLTQELSITRRTVGGSHMRAVLSGRPHP